MKFVFKAGGNMRGKIEVGAKSRSAKPLIKYLRSSAPVPLQPYIFLAVTSYSQLVDSSRKQHTQMVDLSSFLHATIQQRNYGYTK
jgi:hypothetical protein